MTPKQYAFHLVNVVFNLQNIKGVSIMTMKEVRVNSALIHVEQLIKIISTLHKPEYTSFILKDELQWTTEWDTHFHGYDLIDYMKQVKTEIQIL